MSCSSLPAAGNDPAGQGEARFLSGSIGNEETQGVPYWIWLVLPRIFPEYLPGPGGYAALGFLPLDGEEMPVGLTRGGGRERLVAMNCAACHTTSVRTGPDAPRRLVPGGPANRTSPQQYLRFLVSSAADPRFTADIILAEIGRNHALSFLERLWYRTVLIPRTRERLLALETAYQWTGANPDWASGRSDVLNVLKYHALGQSIDQTVGTADTMPLWNLSSRRIYLWDGLSTNARDVLVFSAIAAGSPIEWIDREFDAWEGGADGPSSLRRMQEYLESVRPPGFPFPIDAALSARGAGVFKNQCASCHEPGAPRFESVVPIGEIGTDRYRLDSWSRGASDDLERLGDGKPWKFADVRTSEGYLAAPLDGLWLRAPYLHNGSVPTLADLLSPVDERPATFRRGIDLYDPSNVGFVSEGPLAEAQGTLHDTNLPGNSNAGHLFGTTLPSDDKRALLEYLKTR